MSRPPSPAAPAPAEPDERAERARRRNHSEPRARLLALLRSRAWHPTAADLFDALRAELPRLSLGTVYRNLELLVDEGIVEAVPSAGGALRYDANLEPHHHFHCEACGAILDLALPLPRGLVPRLRREHGLEAVRIRIDIHGRCNTCTAA